SVLDDVVSNNATLGTTRAPYSGCRRMTSGDWDCTRALERKFGLPAVHPLIVRSASTFSCRVMRVETASVRDAADVADGIGFYYSDGYASSFRFTAFDKLVEL